MSVNSNLEHVVASRRVRVYSIVLEGTSRRREGNLVKEFVGTLNFDPGLPKTSLFVAHVLDLDISLLVWIITPEEQVTDILAVNLQGADLDKYLLVEVALVPIDFMLNEQSNSREDA